MTIKDERTMVGIPIKEMDNGTWFVTNLGLFIKAAHDTCVDAVTGKRTAFNEEFEGQPVEVDISIKRNKYR